MTVSRIALSTAMTITDPTGNHRYRNRDKSTKRKTSGTTTPPNSTKLTITMKHFVAGTTTRTNHDRRWTIAGTTIKIHHHRRNRNVPKRNSSKRWQCDDDVALNKDSVVRHPVWRTPRPGTGSRTPKRNSYWWNVNGSRNNRDVCGRNWRRERTRRSWSGMKVLSIRTGTVPDEGFSDDNNRGDLGTMITTITRNGTMMRDRNQHQDRRIRRRCDMRRNHLWIVIGIWISTIRRGGLCLIW